MKQAGWRWWDLWPGSGGVEVYREPTSDIELRTEEPSLYSNQFHKAVGQ